MAELSIVFNDTLPVEGSTNPRTFYLTDVGDDKFSLSVTDPLNNLKTFSGVAGSGTSTTSGVSSLYDVSSITGLEALILEANTNPSRNYEVFLSSDIDITGSLSIPSNFTINAGKGYKYKVAAGQTLTISGAIHNPGNAFIFADENGDLPDSSLYAGASQPKTRYFIPEWFGASGNGYYNGNGHDDTKAVETCVNVAGAGRIYLSQKYRVTRTLDFSNKIIEGMLTNSSAIFADNTTGGFSSDGYAIMIGNDAGSWAGSYQGKIRELWFDMSAAPGINCLYCPNYIGEESEISNVTIGFLHGGTGATGIYVDDNTQGLKIDNCWIMAKTTDKDYTCGIRMPKGRSWAITNTTVVANVCCDVDGDGGCIQGCHLEGVATVPDNPICVKISSRGGGADENKNPVVSVRDTNFRIYSEGTGVWISSNATGAAIVLETLSKLMSNSGEVAELAKLVSDDGAPSPVSTTSSVLGMYCRQGTGVLTTDPSLG